MDILYTLKKETLRRGLSHQTTLTYVQCVKQFFRKCDKEPKKVTKRDIKDYLDVLIERGACGNTLNVHISALKFMFEEILCKKIMLKIKYSRTPKKAPVFLSKQEVLRLFDATANPKYLLILELIYSAGLRVGEAVKLRRLDLEFERNMGWVRNGKGGKDRPFIIARCLVPRLREYVNESCPEPTSYLFRGNNGHLSKRSVQSKVKEGQKKARIDKCVSPHILRHSFATHLIENGYDVATVQPLLGHSSAKTTLTYVHMASPMMLSVQSPYDSMVKNSCINGES